MNESGGMDELHVNDLCPECGTGVMLAVELIGDRHALVLECDRCRHRHAIPPGPISSAEVKRWSDDDAP
jgi:ribosomal protein S27AE